MSLHEITIERLALGGSGVGRINDKVCFVPFTAPGDRLQVRLTKEHRSYSEATAVTIIEPSPLRIPPRCPAFGQCGGCDWQHIGYQDQCAAKQALLRETLQRIARMATPPVAATAAADQPYGYRARVQFKLHAAADGLAAGFFRRGSRFVIDLPSGCPVATAGINQGISRLRGLLQDDPERHRIPQISLEEGLDGVVAIIHYLGSDHQRMISLLRRQQTALGLSGLFLQTGRKDTLEPVFGSGQLAYQVPLCGSAGKTIPLWYSIGSFSQVNRSQNRRMVSLVCGYAQPAADQRLLDIYCGNGNLSLPLAAQVLQLLGIEGYAPSIASAVDNAGQLRVNNSTFKCQDAAAAVRDLAGRQAAFDLVLLDPPRAGARELLDDLAQLAAKRIVYVSCDPATLARDLAILCGKAGYRLQEATPLDMFPQTGHLETVALLER